MINEMTHRKLNNPNADGAFGLFWDEYHSIEQTPSHPVSTEDDTNTKEDYDKNETEIQWLSDVGFTNIAKKIRERQTIDQNDDDMKMIAASLTRSQANAVRRRIEYLNDIIQKNYQVDIQPTVTPARKHTDVRDIFDKANKSDLSTSPAPPAKVTSERSKSCSVDDSCKKHHHGQRYVSVSRNRLAKAYSDATSPDVPQIIFQKSYLEKQSSPPPIAPKPKEQAKSFHGRNRKVVSPVDQRENQDVKSKKSPENEKRVSSTSGLGKGKVQPSRSNESSNQAPGSAKDLSKRSGSHLIFMTGEEREKAINDKSKSNRSRHSSTSKNNNIKKQDGVAYYKSSDAGEYNRRHSASTENIKGDIKALRKTKSVDKNMSDHVEHGNVEIDGATHSSELLNYEELKMIAIDNNYIDVDDDSFDKLTDFDINRATNTDISKTKNTDENKLTVNDQRMSNGMIQSDGLRKHTKNKNPPYNIPSQDYNISPAKTSQQNFNVPYMNNPNTIPYPLPTEISVPYNISTPRDRNNKNNISSSSSPVLNKSFSTPATAVSIPCGLPTFVADNISKKHGEKVYPVSSSPVFVNDVIKSPKETRLSTDVESKKYKDPSQNRLSMNNLSISNVNHNIELLHSGSDDSKSLSSHGSLGSMGSTDDLRTSNIENETTQSSKARRLYDECGDQAQTSIGMNIDNSDRSPGPEGDARLDVGQGAPRDQSDTQSAFSHLPKFPPLPNFNLSKDITGMTEVGDLSDADMERVRSIALIELTALFDAYSIPMNRRKPLIKPKFKDSAVFGVHLTTLSQREENKKHKEGRVPRVFKEMLIFLERHGLKEEGVLRIPGSALRIKCLREAIDKNDLNSVKWEERNVKDVASCLKQFLRDLPEPLLSHEYQNTFISVADLPDRKIQLQALNLLVILLKPVHQKTLKALLSTLNKIIDNEASNKMGLDNVAMIMAPNLLLQSGNKIDVDGQQKAEIMTDIMRMLIKYQAILWTIPSFMVGQIRYVNDSGVKTKDPKTVLKIISKQRKSQSFIYGHKVKQQKSSGSSGDELEQFEEEIIRVKAPSLSKQSMAIKLLDDTTAADVIAKFQWRRQNSQKEKDDVDTSRLRIDRSFKKEGKDVKYHLYECGGNINERRLEGSANISAILKVNPYGGWVLKS